MGKIMQTVLEDVDSSQFVLIHVIVYLILESSTQTMWLHEYYCFLKHEYDVINNVRAKRWGLLFMGHRVHYALYNVQSKAKYSLLYRMSAKTKTDC